MLSLCVYFDLYACTSTLLLAVLWQQKAKKLWHQRHLGFFFIAYFHPQHQKRWNPLKSVRAWTNGSSVINEIWIIAWPPFINYSRWMLLCSKKGQVGQLWIVEEIKFWTEQNSIIIRLADWIDGQEADTDLDNPSSNPLDGKLILEDSH